jgi:hypothetical protein
MPLPERPVQTTGARLSKRKSLLAFSKSNAPAMINRSGHCFL